MTTPSGKLSRRHGPANFDREVYAVVRKYLDDQSAEIPPSVSSIVPRIYDYIKNSNSSLARRKKPALEGSIERILEVIQDESCDSMEDLEFHDAQDESLPQADASRAMNRAIARSFQNKPDQTARLADPPKSLQRGAVKSRKRDRGGEIKTKKRKEDGSGEMATDWSSPTHVSLDDMGGVDDVIEQLEDLLMVPLKFPQACASTGISPPRGILLHGPPGCGKTTIANAFASALEVPFLQISAPSIVSGMSGESEKTLREHFERAVTYAPCLVFIDEIDAIATKRENSQREMEKRIVAQLATCMDDMSLERTQGRPVIVLAATNRPDSLDPALRRGGRFDREIMMPMPSETARKQILVALTRQMRIDGDVDFDTLARKTPAFAGADLKDLVSTAGAAALHRLLETVRTSVKPVSNPAVTPPIDEEVRSGTVSRVSRIKNLAARFKEIEQHSIDQLLVMNLDFLTALPRIQSSAKRQGFAKVPSTTWEDVGALSGVREDLDTNIVQPILHPDSFKRAGIVPPSGVLLWGPPGCGKTLLAKALANQTHATFISIKGPELLSKYVGDSERKVRELFTRAMSSVPCIIFFDEIDALVPKREDALNEASSRVVSALLVELDGLGSREGIYIIGATNRPNQIDEALMRPGRLEKLIFVDLPSAEERIDILRTLARPLGAVCEAEELEAIARDCKGFSGADLSSLIRQAGFAAIKREELVQAADLRAAIKQTRPSVKNYERYKRLEERLYTST